MRRAMFLAFLGPMFLSCTAEDEMRTVLDGGTDSETAGGTPSDSAQPTSDTQIEGTGCDACTGVGGSLLEMACALDLCDDQVLLANTYNSPTYNTGLEDSYEAVARFGNLGNDLAPRGGDSYALMATGKIEASYEDSAPGHSSVMDFQGDQGVTDPWAKGSDNAPIHDVVEWTLTLRTPDWAKGFAVDYVFFSAEYEEYVGSKYNDKFYILLTANSTGGKPMVVNYTACRNPAEYSDFICGQDNAPAEPNCENGSEYCYIAVNTALSECCWLEGCTSGVASTNIDGTGYSCASSHVQECSQLDENGACNRLTVTDDADRTGGTTGWLSTTWPLTAGETFTLTFHLHDTADSIFDSAVLLDNFRFVENADPGTVVVK